MSWIEKIKDQLIIVTGDGQRFTPNWLSASFVVDYNVAQFEFPELYGSLVKRSQPIGRKYNLELYFQGENHLDTANRFELASRDQRPWTMQHPFYGTLIVQPTSLNFDNTEYNVSKITGTVIETIVDDNPKVSNDPIEATKLDKELLDETFIVAFENTEVSSEDILKLKENNKKWYEKGVKILSVPEEFEQFTNAFNQANTFIDSAVATPLQMMRATQSMISQPALFTANVKNRLTQLSDQFNTLRDNIVGIFDVSSKKIYQNHAGTCLSAMCLASATPLETDYRNSKQVFEIADIIINAMDAYMADLDSLQTDNGGELNSFIPDASSIIALNNLFNMTVSSLYNIGLNARSERSIIIETDTNLIVLTHRLYSLDLFDRNIQELMDNNELGLNGILQIKKNTKIIYYI